MAKKQPYTMAIGTVGASLLRSLGHNHDGIAGVDQRGSPLVAYVLDEDRALEVISDLNSFLKRQVPGLPVRVPPVLDQVATQLRDILRQYLGVGPGIVGDIRKKTLDEVVWIIANDLVNAGLWNARLHAMLEPTHSGDVDAKAAALRAFKGSMEWAAWRTKDADTLKREVERRLAEHARTGQLGAVPGVKPRMWES